MEDTAAVFGWACCFEMVVKAGDSTVLPPLPFACTGAAS